ncbi:MAG: TrkA family potassium uptake protein [bacterium]|nr:TrkA family potassium uptake protein [bacterium]
MKKTFMVIGLGRFGSCVARVLVNNKCDIIAIDKNEKSVRDLSKIVNNCVIADSTSLSVLSDLDANKVDHAVVAIGNNLQASILTVINLKKLGVKKITVRADDITYKEVFEALGATDVIVPEESSALSLGNQIMSDTVLDYYGVSDDYAMVKVIVGKSFVPKNLIELNLRSLFDVNIVGITRDGKFFIPRGTDSINPKDVVVVVGTRGKISKLDDFFNKEPEVKKEKAKDKPKDKEKEKEKK